MLHQRIPVVIALACAAASGLLAPAAAHAQAGPPLITDDPGTPGDGNWEINFALTVEKTRSQNQYELPLLDINYGWGDRTQLKIELPCLVLDEQGEGPKGGLGDSLLGVKYRFLDEDRHGLSMSVYPQISINNPTRSVQRGLVESGTNVLLPVQASHMVGPFEVGIEVGYQLVQHGRDEWVYGIAIGYPLSEKFELLGEVHGTADQAFRRNEELVFNVGCRWAFSDDVGLLFAIGRSFYDRDGAPELLVYSGLQFTF